jgi:hypothetical protein
MFVSFCSLFLLSSCLCSFAKMKVHWDRDLSKELRKMIFDNLSRLSSAFKDKEFREIIFR